MVVAFFTIAGAVLSAAPWCPAPPSGFDVTPLSCVSDPGDRHCHGATHCEMCSHRFRVSDG